VNRAPRSRALEGSQQAAAPGLGRTRLALAGGGWLDLSAPRVMGVINVTPDSFSDGGRFVDPRAAIERGLAQAEAGAAVLDVGGESTRPGAAEVSLEAELERVLPVVEGLAAACSVPISIDTRKGAVARAALAVGAKLVNDVSTLADPELARAAAECGAGLILGHIRGTPADMQASPSYKDVLSEVWAALADACERARALGVQEDALAVDPGIGFGKTLEHNLALLANLARLRDLGPVVVGLSRKRMLGELLDRPVDERMAGGLGGAVAAVNAGARLVRTHDVGPTVDALSVAWAVQEVLAARDADAQHASVRSRARSGAGPALFGATQRGAQP